MPIDTPGLKEVKADMDNMNTRLQIVLLVSLLLVFAIIVTYHQVINFDFVGYDDELYITKNINVQKGLTYESVKWAFTTFHSANWHPLTWISHMLDYELYGLNPQGHHWTSVQFHIANSLLLFFILFQMTGALWRSVFVAALFALHPLHVESVAWVSERKDLLSTFFGMLTILAYCRYVKKRSFISYLLTVLFLSMGLMAKPMLVTFPFVLLLLDYWPLKRLRFDNIGSSQAGEKISCYFKGSYRLILEKIPFLILVVFSCILTFLAQNSEGAVKSLEVLPLKSRVENALVSYVGYVFKAIWPRKLAVFYPHSVNILSEWKIIGAGLLISVAILLSIRTVKKYPYIGVGLFMYLGTLVPVIGLLQVGDQAMADRYTYIPLIGIFIVMAWGVSDLFKKWRYRKSFLGFSGGIILCVLSVISFYQLKHWQNGITLFENAVKVTENNFIAQNNLGTALASVDLENAIFHYKAALKINSNFILALCNLGLALYNKGNYDEAVLYFTKALKIDPQKTDARMNLANVLFIQGKYDESLSQYNETIKTDSQNADVHYNLAYVLFTQDNLEKAVLHYQEAIRINPKHEKAHYNLGNIKIKQGKTREAFAHFAEVVKIKPDYVQAYNKIGLILFKQGKFKKAKVFFLKAIQIDPNYSEARKNLKILMRTKKSSKP
jgi:protein O-mannosyl-transferase